ncbi:hypothetical protein FSBG_00501 [Fusobacterium gonidiaformans 3-1-5R]|uniref:Uracil-DNA glycosylase-like domain-containing protein n=1 Tax=Fusobacterium gonidiaformans 3-1-5R TaxID=469605 RepID=E5BFX3_9FUSO|nr:DNA-deoxyinosine glycosylase [Fusobacterium gonidiaformans ATCC 25563]EFS21004.1 hypothetical protein FSBG_00501 [Fusobacterium gonidiaformans 3-1-5R]
METNGIYRKGEKNLERKKRIVQEGGHHGEMLERIVHPFPAFYQKNSTILILGSFPSVKSREENFFYGHLQNRFWKMLAKIFEEEFPETQEQKKKLLKRHKIALWDVIHSCKIKGSSDSSIQDVIPNDLTEILRESPIQKIICNGGTSYKYYKKYQEKILGKEAILMPSTSPANAGYSLERLVEIWRKEFKD